MLYNLGSSSVADPMNNCLQQVEKCLKHRVLRVYDILSPYFVATLLLMAPATSSQDSEANAILLIVGGQNSSAVSDQKRTRKFGKIGNAYGHNL